MVLQRDGSVKLRWDKAYKWAKHGDARRPRTDRIYATPVADVIVAADEGWIRRFYIYRSNLIRYESAKVVGELRYNLAPPNPAAPTCPGHSISAFVPEEFIRSLKLGDSKLAISEAADVFVLRVLSCAEEILDALHVH